MHLIYDAKNIDMRKGNSGKSGPSRNGNVCRQLVSADLFKLHLKAMNVC
ncbi:Hypothetical protein NGAL_HAMBI2610_57730 [Neorhizobium galegae bv. orientalis]|nr:Hypothetical protein NGAL_HAMBI2610_57730 [Neorhizobium galegae bv. orientalis]